MLMYEVTAALDVDSSFVNLDEDLHAGRSGGRLSPSFHVPRCSIRAKVVHIAHAIEARVRPSSGRPPGFMPERICAGRLMEHLGTWNEGDKRASAAPRHGRSSSQVTKEDPDQRGPRYLVHQHRRPLHGDDARMKRSASQKKITGEKNGGSDSGKQMEKLEYPDHLGFIVPHGRRRPAVEGPEGRPQTA